MKKIIVVLALMGFSLAFAGQASAQTEHACQHDSYTIVSIHHCISHAVEMGHIDNAGIAQSLLAKVDSAQAAEDRGQTGVAVNLLKALVHEIEAQSGKHIESEHEIHLADHIYMVIDTLGN